MHLEKCAIRHSQITEVAHEGHHIRLLHGTIHRCLGRNICGIQHRSFIFWKYTACEEEVACLSAEEEIARAKERVHTRQKRKWPSFKSTLIVRYGEGEQPEKLN